MASCLNVRGTVAALAFVSALVSFRDALAARIPPAYQEVAYIETAKSGQYVETGYAPSIATDVALTGRVPFSANGLKVFYWTRLTTGGGIQYPTFGLILNSTTQVRSYHHTNGSSEQTTSVTALSEDIAYETSGRNYTINGQAKSFAQARDVALPTVPLFVLNQTGKAETGYDYAVGMRLSSLRFSENGVTKRDFVPCRRKSDGVVGLFDRSGCSADPFYTNANTATGAFNKGEDCGSADATLTVMRGSDVGTCSPTQGYIECPDGTNFICTAQSVADLAAGTRAAPNGYVLETYDADGNIVSTVTNLATASYVHTQAGTVSHRLIWLWKTEVRVLIRPPASGKILVGGQELADVGTLLPDGSYEIWADQASSLVLSAVPEAGQVLAMWTGDVDSYSRTKSELALPSNGNLSVSALFGPAGDAADLLARVNAAKENATIEVTPGIYKLTEKLVLSQHGITLKGTTGNPADVVIDGQGVLRCASSNRSRLAYNLTRKFEKNDFLRAN